MSVFNLSPDNKRLFLGSAMWGWGVSKREVFELLDEYASCGETLIDHATNYPINGIEKDFGIGLEWLTEWLALNSGSGLEVLVKVGSLNNSGRPDSDLSPSKIEEDYQKLVDKLGHHLRCIAVHWDNRISSLCSEEIRLTLEKLLNIQKASNCRIGISGIKDIQAYSEFFSQNSIRPLIQVKENILTSESRTNYSSYFNNADYVAYGINLGGLRHSDNGDTKHRRGLVHPEWLIRSFERALKLDDITPAPMSFYDLSLYLSYINKALSGVIIGPKNREQLKTMRDFWLKLQTSEALHSYLELKAVLTHYSNSK